MDQPDELARVFNDSYERVMNSPGGKSGEFWAEFYALLISASPEAARKFANTDVEAQVRMLHASVSILLAFYTTGRKSDYLSKLAEGHGKGGVDIPPSLYSVWLDCLIETVRLFDQRFNDDVAAAWRSVFSKGIEFMISQSGDR